MFFFYKSVQAFYRLFMYVLPLEISYQVGRVRIPSTGLSPPHFHASANREPGISTSYVLFIDIGGIDDHHCLAFFSDINNKRSQCTILS